MKFIWEEEDIRAGRMFSKPGNVEAQIIGYHVGSHEEDKWASVSLVDGMISTPTNRAIMATALTENGYIPVEFMGREK